MRSLYKVPDLELRGLLLLLADRRLFEPLTVERAFEGSEELRREVAITLGRVGDRAGLSTLQALLLDESPEVRHAAVFALGQLGRPEAQKQLLQVAAGPDRVTAVMAIGALARCGASVADVGEALVGLEADEIWYRLLPFLHRFPGDGVAPLARLALTQAPTAELRADAAYALAREPRPGNEEDLRGLLTAADPWQRALAAQALGRIGDGGDLERLRPLLDDSDPLPVIQALGAGARLVASARGAAPPSWRELLRRLLDDPRPAVRSAAIEASSAWLLDDLLEAPLLERATAGDGWEADLALRALGRAAHPRAVDLAWRAAVSPRPAARAAAAAVAARAGVDDLLEALATDPAPSVRQEVFTARLDALSRGSWEDAELDRAATLALATLADPDPAVRATVFDALGDLPVVSVEQLVQPALEPARLVQAQLAAARALVARARAIESEAPAAVAALTRMAGDGEWLVRRQAALGLVQLGQRPPPLGPVATRRTAADYEGAVLRTRQRVTAEIVTARGTLRLELDCPATPMTCISFVQLAEQGFYDGLTFHRLEPGFVIQGGDPRGDGWGGSGYHLRDERTPDPFDRGAVGMALSGPDTAGSQFFITLSRQPQLDGAYTRFAHVVAGDELLDRLEPGDRIEAVRIVR